MTQIAVIDYGMGNLRSVTQALVHVAKGANIVLTDDPQVVASADKVVFPGQGAMRDCMLELEQRGLKNAVIQAAQEKPFFGICVGGQLLFEYSEEGDTQGIGFFPGQVLRFPQEKMIAETGEVLKVPHMGWNQVWQQPHPLWHGIEDGARFYFVHSYYMKTPNANLVLGQSDYPFRFTCAVGQKNVFATQFHPEKSHSAGLQLLANFVQWNGLTN